MEDVRHISELSRVPIITPEMIELVNELKNSFKTGYIQLPNGAYAISVHTITTDKQAVLFYNHEKYFMVEVVFEGQEMMCLASASDKCFKIVPSSFDESVKFLSGEVREEALVLTKDEFCVVYPTQAYKAPINIPTTSVSEVKKVSIYIPFKK